MASSTESVTKRTPGVEFLIGGLAAVSAGFFTNPVDVVKVRLQLQGELEARGSYTKIYKNTLHAAYIIGKHEGVLALQAGLVPALTFQLVLNGVRLGTFKTAQNYGLIVNKEGNTDVLRTMIVSGLAGCAGAVLGSPFYLVKTQIQAQSAKAIAVGHQHSHSGSWDAYKKLWKQGGFAGLFRGWNANLSRLFVGSATQLTTFGLVLDQLHSLNIFPDRPLLLTFLASAIGGSCVAITMQPFDVLATRLYNQKTDAAGKGVLYKGLGDAFVKIFRTEGITGLYKGTFPTWLRIAPHTVLCLVFYEKLEQMYNKL